MRYFKKISLVFFLFFIFVFFCLFLKKQTEYIEFKRLENVKKINSLEERIINYNDDLLYKVNKALNDIKHKQDYLTKFTNSSKNELLAREVDRLLFIAKCQISISNNIEGAVSTLESIILFINEVSPNDLLFNQLLEDIKVDLSALRKFYTTDFIENMDKLRRLSDLIKMGFSDQDLPSIQLEDSMHHVEYNNSQGNYWYSWASRAFYNLRQIMISLLNRLSNVVELRKVYDSSDIGDRNIQSLLIQQISIAQFALVMNHPSLLNSSMNYIIETISLFYDINSIKTIEALAIAKDINSIKIENNIPDISRSLNSVKKLFHSNFINN